MVSSLLGSLTDSAAALGAVVVAIALVVLGSWIGRCTAPTNTVTAPDTVTVEAPLTPSDILDATTPTQVTEYDTSETRTDCIQVPTWLASVNTADSSSFGQSQDTTSSLETRPDMQGSVLQSMAGPTYAITPMTTGRPSLSVGSSEVTLSGYLPDGRGRQWTYDIPQPTWAIAPSVTAEATPEGPAAGAALTVSRKSLAVSAGYEVATNYHGWAVGLTWTPYKLEW
jgi:hypothetical protein